MEDGGRLGLLDAGWGSDEGWTALETHAHLRLLARRGLVVGSGGPVPSWTAAVR